MPRKKPATKAGRQAKIADVMGEYKRGALRSGSRSGPKVTKPRQAVAIAMRQAGMPRKASRKKR